MSVQSVERQMLSPLLMAHGIRVNLMHLSLVPFRRQTMKHTFCSDPLRLLRLLRIILLLVP
jgi:hypothetical protein